MDPIRFARQLRAMRIRRELRQEDVARVAGVSRSVVSRLELGRIEVDERPHAPAGRGSRRSDDRDRSSVEW
jgi:DNA-binding transcriptional regulator YiaG